MSEDEKNFDFVEMTGQDRLNFNQKFFDDPIFDTKIFNVADQVLVGYTGGIWDYLTFRDAAFFRLAGENPQTLRNPHSGEEYEMDASLAGIIITMYTLGVKLGMHPTEDGCKLWYRLRDLAYNYAEEIGQFQQVFGMLD
jgi:hypothetical protein